jgi:hypothetical protein
MHKWMSVSAAPRDGTPIILWIADSDTPPAYPVTVGVWVTDDITRVSYWRVFGDPESAAVYFDQHIMGWKPLPRVPDA